MTHRIHFGTAGLRSKMGAGFTLMNELTVIQATQGLIRYMQEAFKDEKKPLSVVIGFDARHQSHQFARLAAALFAHEQFRVYLFDSITVPTPMISFSVKKLKCQGGIVVTASHNPKSDNGYKVYWNNGAQIISPVDMKIAEAIEKNLEPWKDKAWQLDILDKNKSKLVSDPIDEVYDSFIFYLHNFYFIYC
jgi:phosphoglucomutase/phosphopentomutase